ncbi:IPT/TIG domain-containing protein [Fuerstiella marisgermanici]|uniref:IPT/TIG domain protein n=1 Tax=Fuerstiella marisgermanici TaxID=1891926 RepID=A0A1P8WP08_9PLAN|nr:IPT/TIG domain-containing protein [Fuerstiella marisgermanici]APZ95802.1 IPT/TIG domain protein [Fuerstiella marisgermanici]
MKQLIFITTILVGFTGGECFAQFNFDKVMKGVGKQVQREVARKVINHVQPPRNHPRPLPHPTPKPCPKPQPRPWPQPTPQPHPHPVPHPHPHPVQVVYPKPPRCSIEPTPVTAPVQPPADVPEIEVGQRVTIDGKSFGSQTGRVVVMIGSLPLEARIVEWTSTEVTAVLPQLPLAETARANVQVITAYGHTADQLTVDLVPGRTQTVDNDRRDPEAPAGDLPVVTVGQQITLEAVGLGQRQGRLQVTVGGLKLSAVVQKWSDTEVTAVLPVIALTEQVKANIQLVDAGGQVATQIDVMFGPDTTQVAGR